MKKNYLLLIILIIIVSCTKENISDGPELETKESTVINLETSEDKRAIQAIEVVLRKNKKKNFIQKIDYDKIKKSKINNSEALLSIIPVETEFDNITSKAIVLNKNGETKPYLFHALDETSNSSHKFSGKIAFSTLDGVIISGYTVENNVITARYNPSKEIEIKGPCDENLISYSIFCEQFLQPIYITPDPVYEPAQPTVPLDPYTPTYPSPNQPGAPIEDNNTPGWNYSEDGVSCHSFNFQKISPSSNWQEAAVKNITFSIVLLDPVHRTARTSRIQFAQPTLFGMPTNLATGGDISPGLAAELAAEAVQMSMDETVDRYGRTTGIESVARNYFQSRLRVNYPMVSGGGRVNFNALGYSGFVSEFETEFFGNGDCD
jgi:hypothetical protein